MAVLLAAENSPKQTGLGVSARVHPTMLSLPPAVLVVPPAVLVVPPAVLVVPPAVPPARDLTSLLRIRL